MLIQLLDDHEKMYNVIQNLSTDIYLNIRKNFTFKSLLNAFHGKREANISYNLTLFDVSDKRSR